MKNIRSSLRRAAAAGAFLALLAQVAPPGAAQAAGAKPANAGMMRLLKILHQRGSISDEEFQELQRLAEEEEAAAATPPAAVPVTADAVPATAAPVTHSGATPAPGAQVAGTGTAEKKPAAWYEKLSIRGYAQIRHHSIIDQDGAQLDVPADRSVSETDSFLIRRGRVVLSGDVSDHLYIYAQTDMAASPSSGDFSLQMRDLYADISIDQKKEFRFRVGQSKVPFGWVNLQSSQNRLAVERPDGLNSAAEGERDVGAFFYWAPQEARKRFKTLVSTGLRGSGDYGVFGLGAYSGQGPNRRDLNGDAHWVARLTYPFLLGNGQFFELGAQGYTGRFVVRTEEVTVNNVDITPAQGKNGVKDERVGATFVWYPQPFGVEAEWNYGRGPELNSNASRIDSSSLHGGYVQFSWRVQDLSLRGRGLGEATPFTRWSYFDGGRKYGRNAAASVINEIDVGIEWQPIPAVELMLAYTPTFTRTNSSSFPYASTTTAHRIGLQLQFNY